VKTAKKKAEKIYKVAGGMKDFFKWPDGKRKDNVSMRTARNSVQET